MINKKTITILIFIVSAILFRGNHQLAGLSCFLILASAVNLPELFFAIGKVSYSKGNTEKALSWFNRASNLIHSNARIKSFYAYYLLRNGDLEASHKLIDAVLAGKINDMEKQNAKVTLSAILWKEGRLPEAIQLLEEMFATTKTAILYHNLGYFLLLNGEYEKALTFNLEAYDYNSADSCIIDNLAQSYFFTGDLDKALQLYEKLAEMNPPLVTAYYYYALVLLEKNRPQEAVEIFKRALRCEFSSMSVITKEEILQKISETEALL